MSGVYETDRIVSEYLLFHYAQPKEYLPWPGGPESALNFPVRTVRELLGPPSAPVALALDLGCAVGRSTMELTYYAEQVVGADLSRAFIAAAEKMLREEKLVVTATVEGSLTTDVSLSRPSLGVGTASFHQADAAELPAEWAGFDIVHAANLLCRMSDPTKLLDRLPDLVGPGGRLVLTTPCTWLENFTPLEHWPEGETLDWLADALRGDFVLEKRADLPFLIREHARKYQWSVALGTVWRRIAT